MKMSQVKGNANYASSFDLNKTPFRCTFALIYQAPKKQLSPSTGDNFL